MIFMRGDLEHTISGSITNGLASLDVYCAKFVDDLCPTHGNFPADLLGQLRPKNLQQNLRESRER